MMISIYIIITMFLDIILNNIFNYSYFNLDLFFSMLLISSLIFLKLILQKDNVFIILSILLGFLYDLFFLKILPINTYIFFIEAVIIIKYSVIQYAQNILTNIKSVF